MTSSPHDPADCELAVCGVVWELGAHATDCGCRRCETIRLVVRKVLQAAGEPVLLPDRHLEDCAGPGCGASSSSWRTSRAWSATRP